MPLIARDDKEMMQMYSNYSYVFAAMAGGLQEILAGSKSRIPAGILDSAREFLTDAAKATEDQPPYDPVKCAELWAMVNQNLPRELNFGNGKLPRKINRLALLVGELEGIERISRNRRKFYSTIQKLFQNLYDRACSTEYDSYMDSTVSDDDDE